MSFLRRLRYFFTLWFVNLISESKLLFFLLRIKGEKIKKKSYQGFKYLVLNPPQSKQTIFFFHGGAYILKLTIKHLNFLRRLARDTNSKIIIFLYTPLPKLPAKQLVLDSVRIVSYLIEQEDRVVLMGDSAGGGLILSLLPHLKDQNKVSLISLISPFVKTRISELEWIYGRRQDPLISEEGFEFFESLLGKEIDEVYLNPLLKKQPLLRKKIKVFLSYGGREVLLPQILAIEARLIKEGAETRSFFMTEDIHDSPLFLRDSYLRFLEELRLALVWKKGDGDNLAKKREKLASRYIFEDSKNYN